MCDPISSWEVGTGSSRYSRVLVVVVIVVVVVLTNVGFVLVFVTGVASTEAYTYNLAKICFVTVPLFLPRIFYFNTIKTDILK
jgi:hypothetical protein